MKKKLLPFFLINIFALSVFLPSFSQKKENKGTSRLVTKRGESAPIFSEDFATTAQFTNNWTVINENGDSKTWTHNAYLLGTDGVSKGAATANTASTVVNSDYLVTKNPIILEQGAHYLSFQYRGMTLTKKESLRIIYGKTANPSEMKDTIFVNEGFSFATWSFNASNFNVAESGNYYFAFQAFSPANASGFWLDDIVIDAGSFVGSPDITVKTISLPISSCELGEKNTVTCTVSNIGTAPLNGFDLIYRVNGINKKTISYLDTINSGITKTITLTDVADFSEEGVYKVSIIGFSPLDIKNSNDTISATVTHLSPFPAEDFPVSYVFKSSGRSKSDEWYPKLTNGWSLNSYGWKANQDSVPLISRCFDLSPNTYRITFSYRAGIGSDGESAIKTDDFKLLFGLTGTDPESWNTVHEYKNAFTNTLYGTGIASVKIETEGVYTFAFLSTRYNQLYIADVTISVNPDNDVRISEASMNSIMHTMIPAEHLALGASSFKTLVENNGNKDAVKAKVSILGKNDMILTASNEQDISSGTSSLFTVKSSISGYNAGETAKIKLKASMEAEDQLTDDNYYDFSFLVTDSVYAIDKVTAIYDQGIGTQQDSLKFGSVFQIQKADTLTSITIGWGVPLYATTLPFKLALYSVDLNNNTILHNYFTVEASRPLSSSFVTYSIPNLYLQAGNYYVEVQQISKQYIGVASDWEQGKLYNNNENGAIYYMEGFGQLAIRPNFGHNSHIIAKDVSAKTFEKPWESKGLYSNNEPVVVAFENLGYEGIKNLPVVCKVNEQEYNLTIDTIAPYMTAFATFQVDLSSSGEKVITAYSKLDDDNNLANDTISRTIFSLEAIDPYKLDFEACENFAIGHFNPNWTTVDADKSTVVEFDVTFPHCAEALPFMAYNPKEVTPPKTAESTQPYEGERYGASFRTVSGNSNDWLISPKLLLGNNSKLKFYAKTLSASYNLEKFNILISTTDNELESFSQLGDTYQAPIDWTAYEVDLSEYNEQEVHVAIQCVSEKALVFMLDNIEISTDFELSVNNEVSVSHISLYPNPVKDQLQITSFDTDIKSVKILGIKGELLYESQSNLNNKYFRLNTESFSNGIYLASIITANSKKTIKFIINR